MRTRTRRRRVTPTIAVCLVLPLGACASDDPAEPSTSPAATSRATPPAATSRATPPAATSLKPPAAGSDVSAATTQDRGAEPVQQLTRDAVPVTIDAGGGTELHGLRYGTGPRAILLAHMGRPGDSQEDWAPVAVELADAGLTVVTYDRRGVCSPTLDTCSTAGEAPLESWRDVVAATKHVRALGSESVIVGGASLGAMETVDALRREDVEVDGIIWFAGVLSRDLSFERSDFADLPAVPKLFVSAEHDRYGAAEDTRQAYEWSSEPRTLTIVPGSRHGTDLWENGIQEGPGRAVVDVLVDFATSDG